MHELSPFFVSHWLRTFFSANRAVRLLATNYPKGCSLLGYSTRILLCRLRTEYIVYRRTKRVERHSSFEDAVCRNVNRAVSGLDQLVLCALPITEQQDSRRRSTRWTRAVPCDAATGSPTGERAGGRMRRIEAC